ncbi:MAG TPA: hypothetical protein VMF50_02955 [Candidatus Binataceae bacterium]|nr:hypothetical protein [Candidatus Binataceae bacterium]
MATAKKPPDAKDKAEEEKVEKILRNADLKKFDPDLEEVTHPSHPRKPK